MRAALDPALLQATTSSVFRHESLPTLPVSPDLRAMFPEGGLVRGRTVLCGGDAAVALALRIVSQPTQAGSWLGVVGVHNIGVQAASEQGVALQRVVFVQPATSRAEWVSTVAAAADGFDVLMLEVPHGITVADARRVQTRIQSRRNALVLIGATQKLALQSVFQPDVVIDTTTTQWNGIERGSGHVQSREVCVTVSGRRVPKAQQYSLRFVG